MNVKICGLTDAATIRVSAESGARYLGFNFFPKSPRYLTLAKANQLMTGVPEGICKVSLTVNATLAELEEIVEAIPVDMLQLHGQETPEEVAQIRAHFGLPVMKALGVAGESDLAAISIYSEVSDQLLCDAKPPRDAELPGGNGLSFDWRLIANRRWAVPWMLAGGLTADNVAEAIRLTGANQVDVSSGVESAAGVKDAAKIRAFLKAAVPNSG